jgi:succinoglycan biosynthesis transport protein ExoP
MEPEIDLGRYLSALRRWYRLIIALAVLAGVTGLVVSFVLPRTYAAEADVAKVKSGTQVNFNTQIQTVSDLQVAIDQTARRTSMTTIATSPDIAAAVIAKIGDRLDLQQRIPANLLTSITAVNSGDLIKITAKAGSPETAALIANTWAQEYESRVNSIYGDNPLSPTEVQSQADAAKSDYDQKEAALIAYLRGNPIDDLTRQIAQKRQTLTDLVAAENKLDRLLADANSLRTRLSSGHSNNGPGDQLAQVLLEAAAFSATSNLPTNTQGGGQPSGQNDFLPVNLQLRIDQLAGSTQADQISSLDALISALQDRRNAIQASGTAQPQQEINQLQSQLEQENVKRQELARARDLAWSTYTTLESKVAEVNVSEKAGAGVVKVAVTAAAPIAPIAPNKTQNTLLAALVGLMLGIGIAFLLEYMNNNVRSSGEIETLLGLATVGAIPELPRSSANAKPSANGGSALAVQEPRSAAAEAFRLLRYNLSTRPVRRVLAVASAKPAEGKSTVAANLAVLTAQAGKEVTLVDADLRRPSQHEFFHLKNDRGLANLLTESPDHWQAYSQETAVDGLRVIPSGPVPADPTKLLEGNQLGDLIEKLKAVSDIMIIDTPAVLGLADAVLAARAADAILMVIEDDSVSRGDALRAKELLASTNVPIVGAVLNRAGELPGAAAYKYYASAGQDGQSTANGHKGIRDRLFALVGPRRGG